MAQIKRIFWYTNKKSLSFYEKLSVYENSDGLFAVVRYVLAGLDRHDRRQSDHRVYFSSTGSGHRAYPVVTICSGIVWILINNANIVFAFDQVLWYFDGRAAGEASSGIFAFLYIYHINVLHILREEVKLYIGIQTLYLEAYVIIR